MARIVVGGGASQAELDGKANIELDNIAVPAAGRRDVRSGVGFHELSAAQRVTASSQDITEFSPHDIREISHNQAIRALPANGTEVETDRLYFGDDAAWDEEIYLCIQDQTLTADDRPEIGVDWQTYFEKVTTRIKQVATLPAPRTVNDRDLGKIHAVRSDHDGVVSMLAHVAAVEDGTVGEFTAEHDGAMVGHWGSRGHLTGYLNIERLDEVDGGAGTKRVVMLVAENGGIPSENTPRGIYFRESGTSGNWTSVEVTAGADDEYESLAYADTISLFAEHTTYDLVVTSDGTGEAPGQTISAPPNDDRYAFLPAVAKVGDHGRAGRSRRRRGWSFESSSETR